MSNLTEEEKGERRKKHNHSQYQKRKSVRNSLIDQYIGDKCLFCHKSYSDGIKLISHRKDGKKHIIFQRLPKSKFEEEIENNKHEYVRLCFWCHRIVHWCMEHLGMTWDEITTRLDHVILTKR